MQQTQWHHSALFECSKVYISIHLLKNILLPSLLISLWLLLAKFALFLFLFLQFHWLRETKLVFQSLSSWDSQKRYYYSLSSFGSSSSCTWSLSLGIFSSSWPLSPTPYSTYQVLLSLQRIFSRHLFHLYHHPKDAVEHPDSESSYHLWRLNHTDVFFSCFLGY